MSHIDKLTKIIKYRNDKVFLKTVFRDTCRLKIILSSDTYSCIDILLYSSLGTILS